MHDNLEVHRGDVYYFVVTTKASVHNITKQQTLDVLDGRLIQRPFQSD